MLNLTDINFTGKTNAELDRSQKLWKIGFLSDKEAKIFKKCNWKFMGVPYKCTSYCLEEREKRVFSL